MESSQKPPLRWQRAFPGEPAQMSRVRHWIDALFPGSSAGEDLMLVAVELATNAVKFTGSGHDGWFVVEITWLGHHVQVAVADGGAPEGPRLIENPLGENGRGLLMVKELSTRFGVRGDHRGRLVWADLPWHGDEPGASAPAGGHETILTCGTADLSGRLGIPLPLQHREMLTCRAAPGDLPQGLASASRPDGPGAVPVPRLYDRPRNWQRAGAHTGRAVRQASVPLAGRGTGPAARSAMTPASQRLSLPDHQPEHADLEQLAGAPAEHDCATSLYSPPPFLNMQPPGGQVPHWVCAAGPYFSFQETAEPIGSRTDIPAGRRHHLLGTARTPGEQAPMTPIPRERHLEVEIARGETRP
jgi:serine/threonine-protein kinase RsbW